MQRLPVMGGDPPAKVVYWPIRCKTSLVSAFFFSKLISHGRNTPYAADMKHKYKRTDYFERSTPYSVVKC